MKISLLIFIMFLFNVPEGNAQEEAVVTGRLTAFNTYPVTNVLVTAKKSLATALTDSAGFFSIVCHKKDKLIIKPEGFAPVRKAADLEEPMLINLVALKGKKHEQAILAYGYLRQEELSYGISSLSNESVDYSKYQDIFDLLEGRLPNVRVINSSGVKRVLIGGPSSIRLSNYAIYAVDGIIMDDVSSIHPSNVESVAVLKNASASMYGSKATNGVVLITLKK